MRRNKVFCIVSVFVFISKQGAKGTERAGRAEGLFFAQIRCCLHSSHQHAVAEATSSAGCASSPLVCIVQHCPQVTLGAALH